MNNPRINTAIDRVMEAFDTLKHTIAADTSVTLKLELTRDEAEILREIMRMDISIPKELKQRPLSPSLRASEAVMAKVRYAIDR